MAYSHVYTVKFSAASAEKQNTYSASANCELSETVADSTTNLLMNIAIDVSAVTSFYMCSDKALTVKTNSSGSPDNTIVLKANVPYIWNSDSYDTFKLTADVTKIYVTNASGASAALEIHCLQDSTP